MQYISNNFNYIYNDTYRLSREHHPQYGSLASKHDEQFAKLLQCSTLIFNTFKMKNKYKQIKLFNQKFCNSRWILLKHINILH